jgi:hypothetical protein
MLLLNHEKIFGDVSLIKVSVCVRASLLTPRNRIPSFQVSAPPPLYPSMHPDHVEIYHFPPCTGWLELPS